jgi:hypothetical protein
MRNIIAIGISLVLLTAGIALAVDDATLQEVENKAESANTKADGKYVYKPYIIRNLQDSNVGSQVTSGGQIYVIDLTHRKNIKFPPQHDQHIIAIIKRVTL